jgi:type IV pilus assembly protein PilM
VWGVLDIGFKACRLYLMHGDRPVYARVLRGGGRELTETLARALHIDFTVAEQYKRLYGIQQADRGVRATVGGLGRVSEEALPGMLYAILVRTLESLIADIERSFRFAMDRHTGSSMGFLYLVGGGSRLKGLVPVLSQALGIEVRHFHPASGVRNAQADAAGRVHPACTPTNYAVLASCFGLAMEEVLT